MDRAAAGNQWHETGLVFSTDLGKANDGHNVFRAFATARQHAGPSPEFTPHSPRHTAATTVLNAGMPLKVVSEILGHSSVDITARIYQHVTPEVTFDAIEELASRMPLSL